MTKILCIRFSSLGDIILTTPIVRALKTRYPASEIHVATKKNFSAVWENNPYVDQIHSFEGSIWNLAKELRKEKFDIVVDLHKNIRSILLCLLLGKIPFQINKFTKERKAFVKTKVNSLPPKHLVDRNFDALSKLDIHPDGKGLDFFIPESQQVDLKTWGIPEKYMVFAIGAQHITKVLSYPKMIELCDKLEGTIVLIGDRWDENFGYRLSTLFPEKVLNLCDKTTIGQSASIIQQSQFAIVHDSSMMHIAAALQKKMFVIWGSTHPGFGFYPYQAEFTSIENTDLPCRPCTTQGTNFCPLDHFNCMNQLSLEPIINASKAL
ncbi:glycosyltransferase family 9 protein [Aquirufa sp. ROCK-SH2]